MASVRDRDAGHLGPVYGWMIGDFGVAKEVALFEFACNLEPWLFRPHCASSCSEASGSSPTAVRLPARQARDSSSSSPFSSSMPATLRSRASASRGSLWPESSDVQALTNLRRELHHLREGWPRLDALVDAGSRTLAWRGEARRDRGPGGVRGRRRSRSGRGPRRPAGSGTSLQGRPAARLHGRVD